MRFRAAHLGAAAVLASAASFALGGGFLSGHGPLPSYSGARALGGKPAEGNCTLCHLNEGGSKLDLPGGAVEILDLPATYTAGEIYRIRVRLNSDSTTANPGRRWGFQLTAASASNGEGIGTFELDDPDTLSIEPGMGDFASRSYVQHTIDGTRDSLGGPVEWTFSWRAPDTPQDTAFFFCVGTAANGNLEPAGDFTYTAADTVLDVTTPVRPVSWGAVKRRYR